MRNWFLSTRNARKTHKHFRQVKREQDRMTKQYDKIARQHERQIPFGK